MAAASESKNKAPAAIGLTWEPKLPWLPLQDGASASSSSRNHRHLHCHQSGAEASTSSSSFSSQQDNLIDGLYLPPNDPRKLNKLLRKQLRHTAGKHWFDMPAPTLTPELKKDLHLLKLRSAMDPKRHYKKGDSRSKNLPKYFQVGTVIESASEFYTGRLTKKERKATLADELLSDSNLLQYRKRKVQEIEEQNRPTGVDKWKIRGRKSMKRAKQRRH